MYFMNEQHESNYKNLLDKFPTAKQDKQYQVAVYITAVPEIYTEMESVLNLIEDKTNPYSWFFDWKLGMFDDLEGGFYLSGSYERLAKLGANLFNGYEFNLYDGVNTWGNELFEVALQAIKIFK